MARIAGIFSAWPTPKATHELDEMLGRLRTPATQTRSLASGRAVIGAASPDSVPMPVVTRGPFSVVLDGFIFNAREFAAASVPVAEVFLDLYERHGFQGALERINGDFAVALHDASSGTLWLGRDRLGVKPLYYTDKDGMFAFASQLRGLLNLPGVSRRASRQYVALFAGSHYRTFDNDPEASPFTDIAQLPAGHLLEVRTSGTRRPHRYWYLNEQPEFSGSEQALAEEYRGLLIDAVRLRYEAARSPAFTLSGGMDSSSVLACAVRTSGRKQQAFSSVYEDRTYDESDEIRSMLDHAVAEWHPIKIETPDVYALIDRMVGTHDEPVATATWLSHYLLCEAAAAQGFGALFGGLGGDELNAGEYEHFFFHFADLRRAGNEERLCREVNSWAQHHDHPLYRKNMSVVDDALGRLVNLNVPGMCLADRRRLERYRSALAPGFFDLGGFVPVMDQPFGSYLKNRTYQDIFRETAPCCLRAEDRQTSAFGLDHFDPFFDHRLVEFMFRVPGTMKIRDGVTKILLREAMKDLLPEETRMRIKKTGWNAPAHLWFTDGAALDTLRDLVGSRTFRERGIYNVAAVERIIEEHRSIVVSGELRENHMMFLWQLVNLESWFRVCEVSF